ncbi:hypothetical protein DB346_22070 [Verrucomicrobia bacterium LW23]|nr:hypothetical protein DB346_22070 [Verrucomicrobia bacterium LW23]
MEPPPHLAAQPPVDWLFPPLSWRESLLLLLIIAAFMLTLIVGTISSAPAGPLPPRPVAPAHPPAKKAPAH